MPKFKEHQYDKDFDILRDEIQKILDKTETKMNTLIDDYNTKYEEDYDAPQVETCDLSSLFSQLSDFCEDHI
jgi:arsenate reductase-like glutaredoxin family protein